MSTAARLLRPHVRTILVRRSAVLATLTASLLLGACASGSSDPLTANARLADNNASAQGPQSELQKATQYWGKAHAENPTDPRAAVNYARNLKALGAKTDALAVLQAAHQRIPNDRALNSEYGRLALEQQQYTVAEKLLTQADDPAAPDWRTISARGAVMAKQGRHHEAIPHFQRALELAPDQASIQNNLAMAYAMAGQPGKAEPLLRQAAEKDPSDARIAQNLALVLGLQGRHDEAKSAAAGRVSEETLQHNADVVRQMVPTATPETVADAAPASIGASTPGAAARPAAPTRAANPANKGRSTASIATPASKAKTGAASEAVDAAELVRRLADGDVGNAAAVPSPAAAAVAAQPPVPARSTPASSTPGQGPFQVKLPVTAKAN